ncbi:hypothetical protein HYQ44_018304 [Verticillium longisporum]|nr:hypothetical protein HYQ44_018304 [Verticillium longisporum]
MVTEGLPAPCSTCFDEAELQDRPPTSAPTSVPSSVGQATAAIADAMRKMNMHGHRNSSLSMSEQEAQISRAALLRNASSPAANTSSRPSASAIETPPESPRRVSEQPAPRRESSNFRRTYDDNVTKRAGPCENCAMTLPQRQGLKEEKDPKSERGPTLRSRIPWAKVYTSEDTGTSPPPSQTSSASDTDGEGQPRRHTRRATGSTTTRSSMSSTSRSLPSHTHYVHYTSTHEPLIANSFSIVRASCLRALSFETLPRTPQSGSSANSSAVTSIPTPQSPNPTSQPFVTTHSAGAAASGGPIFFGDPLAGYTIAYIFRIPDVHARGHKRVYAFLALSTHRERLIMKIFGFIAAAFREMAAWIQKLAEAEAEKASEASPVMGGGGFYGNGGGFSSKALQDRGDGYGGPDRASGSSFLTGGSGFTRRMGGGGGAVSLKSRGVAELVGMPDFFIQLHEKFVRLLLELGVKLSA